MKKTNYILLFAFILTFNLIQAQDEVKESKFNIIGYGGIGYGIVKNDNEPSYNLNSNSGEILLNYNLNQKFGIATGIGINELSGNGFNSIGNFYHERSLLKIPLLFTLNSKISDDFKIFANLGFFGQTIIKDEYQFINNTQKDIYEGWNFGAQIGLGFLYEIFDNYYAGINYNGQSDFSKFETNNNVGINDEQKMKNLNSVGVILIIEL
ncbi:MAG: outer membrane beta-barrel protein [Ignavibacteriae bacterium]|nr:outer membrane beta-barrel protein [Ignavibacteriota bacterium]